MWFHAEAFGLSSENIDKLIGFRCHMCRQRNPPVCPHLVVVKTDVSQLAEAQNDAGVDFSEEVPNTVPPLSEVHICIANFGRNNRAGFVDAIATVKRIYIVSCKSCVTLSSVVWC